MKKKKFPVAEILNKGKDNAISRDKLKKFFSFTDRELYAEIERERLSGKCILAKKSNGGGYYLPKNAEEKQEYLAILKSSIDSHQSVYDSLSKAI